MNTFSYPFWSDQETNRSYDKIRLLQEADMMGEGGIMFHEHISFSIQIRSRSY